MQIATRQLADVVLIAVIGRVDHRTAAELEQALAGAMAPTGSAQGALVLDFAGVEYISSVGLRALMVTAKQMRALSATFAIAALQPVVAEIFAISRFDRVLSVHPSVSAAIAQCSAAARAAWAVCEPPPAAGPAP